MITRLRSNRTRSIATSALVLLTAAFTVGGSSAASTSVASLPPVPSASAIQDEQSGQEPALSYAKITRKDAILRNVPDANGRELAKLKTGTIVRIHGELAGWSKAEIPTGFAVWVYRKYVTETDDPNVVEVTRNGLNVRVLPSSGVNNYPIGQLYAGDRVRVIETPAEFEKESAEWIYVWSPPGFWAWIRTGHLALVPSGGEAAWKKAQTAALIPRAMEASSTDVSTNPPVVASKDPARADVTREALSRAHSALDRERARTKPNFELVRNAYGAVLKLEPTPEVRLLVEDRLHQVERLEAIASLRADLEAEKARRKLENEELLREIRDESKRRNPLGDRFDERGLLERRTVGEQTRYYLRWGGRDVCEVVCTSGRYDLLMFLGKDVGVRGEVLPLVATDGGATAAPIVDLARIEIVSRN